MLLILLEIQPIRVSILYVVASTPEITGPGGSTISTINVGEDDPLFISSQQMNPNNEWDLCQLLIPPLMRIALIAINFPLILRLENFFCPY